MTVGTNQKLVRILTQRLATKVRVTFVPSSRGGTTAVVEGMCPEAFLERDAMPSAKSQDRWAVEARIVLD
jgi:hypothetical protein